MTLITFSSKEYQRLLEVAHTAHDPSIQQRAHALRWLSTGEDATEVAERWFVTPKTVYRWVHRFHQQPPLALSARLGARPRSGRPRLAGGIIETLLAPVLTEDPRQRGYRSTVWTAALRRRSLHDGHQSEVSHRRVRRTLVRLGLAGQRPRSELARRSATWRPAKGGSNAACVNARARSSSCWRKRA
jgi:transposase